MTEERNVTLPNFFILGGERCGTTSLYHYLKQHPDVFLPRVKEPGYFVFAGRTDQLPYVEAISTFEEYMTLYKEVLEETAVGDASPFYLYRSVSAAPRIRERVDEPRFIVSLRNPIQRAYSAYRLAVKQGVERAPDFVSALKAEPERIDSGADMRLHYTRQGCYAEHLRRYEEIFGRESLHVYLFRDFERAGLAVVRGIFEFLGVDPGFVPQLRRFNGTRASKSGRVRRFLQHPSVLKTAAGRFLPLRVRRRMKAGLMHMNVEPHAIPPAAKELLVPRLREDVREVAEFLGRDVERLWLA